MPFNFYFTEEQLVSKDVVEILMEVNMRLQQHRLEVTRGLMSKPFVSGEFQGKLVGFGRGGTFSVQCNTTGKTRSFLMTQKKFDQLTA